MSDSRGAAGDGPQEEHAQFLFTPSLQVRGNPEDVQGGSPSRSSTGTRSVWNGSGMLAMGAQKVLQARRTVKAFQEGLDTNKQAISTFGANALAAGGGALSALDQRLHLSEKLAATDQTYGLSERAAATKQNLSETAAATKQHLSEVISTARQGLACGSPTGVDPGSPTSARAKNTYQDKQKGSADKTFSMFERFGAVTLEVKQDVAEMALEQRDKLVSNVASLSQKASEQKQKWLSDLNAAAMRKAASLGLPRQLGPAIDPKALCFFDAALLPGIAGLVGLTIDDGPCHQSDPAKCMLNEVRELLAQFDAKATLFLCTDHVPPHEGDLIDFLSDSNEVANHCGSDRSYACDSEQSFEAALLESERVCEELRRRAASTASTTVEPGRAGSSSDGMGSASESTIAAANFSEPASVAERAAETTGEKDVATSFAPAPRIEACGAAADAPHAVESNAKPNVASAGIPTAAASADKASLSLPPWNARWFRAPHADASPEMHEVLERHGFINVLCDSFANDTVLTDPVAIAQGLLSMVDGAGGSIAVIHVPERGFREYNLLALRLFLSGLRERGLRATTVTALHRAAWEGSKMKSTVAQDDQEKLQIGKSFTTAAPE